MDLRLSGRTVFLSGPDDGTLAACGRVLAGEGVRRSGQAPGSDIVVATGHRRPGSDLLAVDDVAQLYDAWIDATQAIEAYRDALPHMTE